MTTSTDLIKKEVQHVLSTFTRLSDDISKHAIAPYISENLITDLFEVRHARTSLYSSNALETYQDLLQPDEDPATNRFVTLLHRASSTGGYAYGRPLWLTSNFIIPQKDIPTIKSIIKFNYFNIDTLSSLYAPSIRVKDGESLDLFYDDANKDYICVQRVSVTPSGHLEWTFFITYARPCKDVIESLSEKTFKIKLDLVNKSNRTTLGEIVV